MVRGIEGRKILAGEEYDENSCGAWRRPFSAREGEEESAQDARVLRGSAFVRAGLREA
jgi:hypothetical protein